MSSPVPQKVHANVSYVYAHILMCNRLLHASITVVVAAVVVVAPSLLVVVFIRPYSKLSFGPRSPCACLPANTPCVPDWMQVSSVLQLSKITGRTTAAGGASIGNTQGDVPGCNEHGAALLTVDVLTSAVQVDGSVVLGDSSHLAASSPKRLTLH